jgi:single-stranded DNA-binding protein
MNNLNSVLLEGTLKDAPEFLSDPDTCYFTLLSHRVVRNGPSETEVAKLSVLVKTTGRLALVYNEYLKKGRGVRVVGWLAFVSKDTLGVMAEHVEFKPTVKKLKGEE